MNFYRDLGFLVFGSRLRRLSELFLSDVNNIYKAHKIPFDASWFPVFYLLSTEGEISIRKIADELGISHSAASQMVSGLQAKGLIKSTVSKKDARHRVVAYTAKGKKLLQKIQPVWKGLQTAMEELTGGQAESKLVLTALAQIEDKLQDKTLFERIEDHI